MIQITAEQIERTTKVLDGVPGGTQKALYNAIQRGATTIRKEAATEAASVYRISASDFKRQARVKSSASSGELSANVLFAGNLIPLIQFKVSYGRGGGVSAAVKKGGGGAIKSAFITNMGFGIRVFERVGAPRFPVEQKYGPSAAHMVNEDTVRERIEKKAQETVDKRLEHEITRLLNGLGG